MDDGLILKEYTQDENKVKLYTHELVDSLTVNKIVKKGFETNTTHILMANGEVTELENAAVGKASELAENATIIKVGLGDNCVPDLKWVNRTIASNNTNYVDKKVGDSISSNNTNYVDKKVGDSISSNNTNYVDKKVGDSITDNNTNYVDAEVGKKVSKAGDTMTGKLALNGGVSINDSSTSNDEMPFFLGIDSFVDGGTIHWVSKENTKVGYSDNSGKLNNQLGSYYASTDGTNALNQTATNKALSTLTNGTAKITDSSTIITSDDTGDVGNYYRRNATSVWTWIKEHTDAEYVNIGGDTMSGGLKFSAFTPTADEHTPTALSYGRLQSYGNFHINANTDNSGEEYILLTAGHGLSTTTSDGLKIGPNDLTWKNKNIIVNERSGLSTSWIYGRNVATIKTNSYSGYDCITSMKTTNGSWEQGVYSDNIYYINYTPDSNYNSGSNSVNQFYFKPSGAGEVVGVVSRGNNYIKFANGLLIQWGNAPNGNNQWIYFPTSFSTSSISVAIANKNTAYQTGSWSYPSAISSITTSYFWMAQTGSDNRTSWIAIGY